MSDAARRSAPPPPAAPRRPEDWTPEQKLLAVTEAAALSEHELGELLRRQGLHAAQLAEWRKAALEALGGPAKSGQSPTPARRVRELERQLRRKDKALAEAAALLILQKNSHGRGPTSWKRNSARLQATSGAEGAAGDFLEISYP